MSQNAQRPYGPNTEFLDRLLSDCRVLGPSGIERIAWAVRQSGVDESGAAQAARDALRERDREDAWTAAERALREMTEGHNSALAWKAEQEGTRHTAEDAALHAALALVVRDLIDRQTYRDLVKPMSETLPWLLPDEPPDAYAEGEPA